jgi:hypothetical protein
MADNYLEDKYEEFLKRKSAWEKSQKYRLPVKDESDISQEES